jgi:gamma-glutamyltranspeptidase / glutathione hydrolase
MDERVTNCGYFRRPPAQRQSRALGVLCAFFAVSFLFGATWMQAVAQDVRARIVPEGATGTFAKTLAVAPNFMVSAANPHAVDAGVAILKAGGSAVDAAIATQLVLNLVEPQSSGIGGGAFLVHFDPSENKVRTYDGRETAPAAAQPDRFLKDGKRMPFRKVVNSGLSVGVPGLVRMMELAHQRHGKLPWARLFEPAIRLSSEGFEVSLRLNMLLHWYGAKRFTPKARAYFFNASGQPRPVGYLLKNPEFANTLKLIAEDGAAAFYEDGPIARSIVSALQSAPNAQGDMTLEDIAGYRALEREPVCFTYRKRRICGMGPPSSGGITVAQTLKLLEGYDLGKPGAGAMSPRSLHLIAEAQKLAYADRNRYLADADFVKPPEGLLAPDYIAERRRLISGGEAMLRPQPGEPRALAGGTFGTDDTIERSGTSHLSIIDQHGRAVSMTTTIEGGFGSGLWASGFLLNNELTDFSFRPVDAEGRPIANRVEGGKRPRSSMSPTLVFDRDGKLEATLGSVGGSRIILYVIKSLIALTDWEMSAQAAADLSNFGSRGRGFEVELGPAAIWQGLKVKPYGHTIVPDLMTSGTHIVLRRRDGTLEGAADPRREGVAKGG